MRNEFDLESDLALESIIRNANASSSCPVVAICASGSLIFVHLDDLKSSKRQ